MQKEDRKDDIEKMNPKMSKRAFAKNFKAKSKDKAKQKWALERGQKVTWKRQRAQDTRSKMLERVPEETKA
jgi:hypothetical protein